MTKTKTQRVEQEVPEKLICDCCGKEVEYTEDNILLLQEFTKIRYTAGYYCDENFEDESVYEADICSACLHKTLGKYLRKVIQPVRPTKYELRNNHCFAMRKKKKKLSIEEQLELIGNETASELYIIYIKHYTSNSKLADKAREIWKKEILPGKKI